MPPRGKKKKDKDAPAEVEAPSAPAGKSLKVDDGNEADVDEPAPIEIPYQPPPAILGDPYDRFATVRMHKIRDILEKYDVERRVAKCMDTLLGAAELPVNPFPTLARLLRREELDVALEIVEPGSSLGGRARKHGIWRESELLTSGVDVQLALLPKGVGSAWRPIAPLLDAETLRYTIAGLAGSQALAHGARVVGNFTVKSCCMLTGSHAFSGRLLMHPRTVEVREHVQVRGPASRLDEALGVFAEHICASALGLHASREHFVQEFEVYTGDSDAFDEEASAEVSEGRTTSNARGTPERFGLVDMHGRAPALTRALQMAAVAQQPVYLHLLVCMPMPVKTADGKGYDDTVPPRWQYVAVQKQMCFFYEPTSPVSKTGASSRHGRAHENDRPVTPPPRFQPLPMQSFFQGLWLSDTDAAWYHGLRENRAEGGVGSGSMTDARAQFVRFMRAQLARFLMRGDHMNLLEALILFMADVPTAEREPLLSEIHTCLSSDAALLSGLSHQCRVMQRTLAAAASPAVPPAKRALAHGVLSKQFANIHQTLLLYCAKAEWADLVQVRPYLLQLLASLVDGDGNMRTSDAAGRQLRRLGRTCHALQQSLADTLISTRGLIRTMVQKLWNESSDVEVPVALQPPTIKVKVVDVADEFKRQTMAQMHPPGMTQKAMLLQYAVDTQLDRAAVRAIEDVLSARVLKGNPISTIVLRMKAYAQHFDLWKEPDADAAASLKNKNVQNVTGALMRRNIYQVRAAPLAPKAPEYHTAARRWKKVSTAAGIVDDGGAGHAAEGIYMHAPESIYGLQPSLIVADRGQLHELRRQLADFMPMRTATVAQRYECTMFTAFCGDMLLHGSFADLSSVHAVEVREDHFVEGPDQHDAMCIHCQHVVQTFLKLHQKTMHVAAHLVFGSTRWCVDALLKDQEEGRSAALMDALRTVRAGIELRLLAYALVKTHGETRYMTVNKAYHLTHFPSTAGSSSDPIDQVQSWPPRNVQLFDSIFLSLDHVGSCLEAESNASTEPLQSWRCRKWLSTLVDRARCADKAGLMMPACKAMLLHSATAEAANLADATPLEEVTPGVARLLSSASAQLHSLSDLNRTIQGVVASALDDHHRPKADNKALARMFHAYRVPTLQFVASDVCNFETLRATIQEGFSAVLTDLRQQGMLTRDARMVLETVDDYMRLVAVALAQQVFACDPKLQRALRHLVDKKEDQISF